MMFEFIAVLVVVVFLFNKLNNKIVDLNDDIVKLQDELRQQKESVSRLKSKLSNSSEQPVSIKQPIPSPASTASEQQTVAPAVVKSTVTSPPPLPDTISPDEISTAVVTTQDTVAITDNSERNNNYSIYTLVTPKTVFGLLPAITVLTKSTSDPVKPLVTTNSTTTSSQPTPAIKRVSANNQLDSAQPILDKEVPVTPVMEPDERSLPIVTSLFNSLKNWFLGGNLVVRVGVLVLLVGVVLLLRLVSEYFETPIEIKLAAIAIVGFGLAGLGLRLATKRFAYGITLQGAGLAIAYLTTFFAYNAYQVIPNLPSFIILGLLSAVTVALAIRQNAFPLALLALSGGFFAPLLTATDTGSLKALFSYYLLLNVAVAIIAHYKTWKVLNVLGITVTFGLAYYFGGFATVASEIDEQRWSLVLLIALHLALYLFIAVRYTQQIIAYNVNYEANTATVAANSAAAPSTTKSVKATNSLYLYPMDIGLLFSVPVLAFGLFAALLHDINQALTITSAILGAVYLGLGWVLIKRSQRYALITEGMLALGFGFLALVVPLAFDAEWIAVGWSIQGVALVWFGRRSLRAWLVIFGLLLQIVSVGLLCMYTFFGDATTLAMTISAIASLGAVFILRASNSPTILLNANLQLNNTLSAVNNSTDNVADSNDGLERYATSLGISTQAARHWLASINSQSAAFKMIWRSPAFISFLTFIAIIWTLYVLITDFDIWFNDWQLATTTLIALATLATLTLYWLINLYRAWAEIRYFSHGLLSVFYVALVLQLPQKFEFNQQWSSINWLIFVVLLIGWALIAQLWLKTWYTPSKDTNKKAHAPLSLYHFASWLGTGILVLAAGFHYGLPNSNNVNSIDSVMTVLIPSLLLIALISYAERKFAHLLPWFDWQKALVGCSFIFIPLLLVWVAVTNVYHDGIVWNLPYIPVINLYDIAIFTVMAYGLSMYHLYTTIQANRVANKIPNANAMPLADWANVVIYAIAIVGFWALSSILVRTLHAYAGTPLWINGALFNDKVQISLVIMWTLSVFFIQRKLPDLLSNFAWLNAFNWQKAIQKAVMVSSYLFVPVLLSWVVVTNWYHSGVVWGLPYIPMLNLYDIAVLLAMGYGLNIYYAFQNSYTQNKHAQNNYSAQGSLNSGELTADNLSSNISKRINILLKVLGIVSFWVLSSILVRTLHAYASTPLWTDGAWGNDKVQTSLTILWTLTALIATFISSRNGKRFWWFMGIGLLGVVVLKLVLVDLSQTGAILRVVSFLVAGSLILLIGYLAPLPPEHDKEGDVVKKTNDIDDINDTKKTDNSEEVE